MSGERTRGQKASHSAIGFIRDHPSELQLFEEIAAAAAARRGHLFFFSPILSILSSLTSKTNIVSSAPFAIIEFVQVFMNPETRNN